MYCSRLLRADVHTFLTAPVLPCPGSRVEWIWAGTVPLECWNRRGWQPEWQSLAHVECQCAHISGSHAWHIPKGKRSMLVVWGLLCCAAPSKLSSWQCIAHAHSRLAVCTAPYLSTPRHPCLRSPGQHSCYLCQHNRQVKCKLCIGLLQNCWLSSVTCAHPHAISSIRPSCWCVPHALELFYFVLVTSYDVYHAGHVHRFKPPACAWEPCDPRRDSAAAPPVH